MTVNGSDLNTRARIRDSALELFAGRGAAGEDAAIAACEDFGAMGPGVKHRLHDDGLLHDDVDLVWAALNVVVLNLATVLFERAISRHLPAPFFSPDSLERW